MKIKYLYLQPITIMTFFMKAMQIHNGNKTSSILTGEGRVFAYASENIQFLCKNNLSI